LGFLSKAISENFDIFNKPRKTHITNIIANKNKIISNLKHKRTTSENKLEEKIKNKRLVSTSENKNYILNRIISSKSVNNKEKMGINSIQKLSNVIDKEKEKIKETKKKNIKEQTYIKNNNKICKNVTINILTKKPKNLTTKNPPQKINIKDKNKSSNNINKPNDIKITKDSQQKQISKSTKENESHQNNNIQKSNINHSTKNPKPQEHFKKFNNIQHSQNQRLTYIEAPIYKNVNITPRLTVPINFLRDNISTQNIFQNTNKAKQINLDKKLIHKQSKSPKNIAIVNKLFTQETNNFKQINNNNVINKHSVSPNPRFGRQTICQKNFANTNNNNNNQLTNSMNNMNNICKVRKINSNINYTMNPINTNINNMNKANNNIYKNINNQFYQNQNQLIYNYPPQNNSSQERLTISTFPINNISQSQSTNNLLYSQRLTNIPNQFQSQSDISNILNQFNINTSLNYNNYQSQSNIISEEYVPKSTKKNFNVTYNSFDPCGVLKNYGILTLPGKDTSGQQKTNQDSFTFFSNVNNIRDFHIFGVLDGHGGEGHFVSRFVAKFIPYQIMNNPEIKNLRDPEMIYNKLKNNNYQIIVKAYLDCDIALQKVNFDSKESGSTCNLIINIGKKIICANTGDSRAIVVFDDNSGNMGNYKCIPLSVDFKPEMPDEMNRILINGGEVRQIKNELGEGVGPYRVWKKGEGYPGLAMSRSIGDLNGKKIGVIPNPGIVEYQLSEKSKYIVVCSDGVWEFLNNESVKNIGNKYYFENNPSGFCHELVNTSFNLWEKNDIVIDDITAVVAFF
jgi:serine/threonine protein phosphatase PrpC